MAVRSPLSFLSCGSCPVNVEKKRDQFTLAELAQQVFLPDNMFTAYNPTDSVNVQSAVVFRGTVLEEAKRAIKSACGDNHRVLTSVCPFKHRSAMRTATLLSNHTGVTKMLDRIREQFVHIYERKAFLNWYTDEGMEEEDFDKGLELLTDIIDRYKTIEPFSQTPLGSPVAKPSNSTKTRLPSSSSAASSPRRKSVEGVMAKRTSDVVHTSTSSSRKADHGHVSLSVSHVPLLPQASGKPSHNAAKQKTSPRNLNSDKPLRSTRSKDGVSTAGKPTADKNKASSKMNARGNKQTSKHTKAGKSPRKA